MNGLNVVYYNKVFCFFACDKTWRQSTACHRLSILHSSIEIMYFCELFLYFTNGIVDVKYLCICVYISLNSNKCMKMPGILLCCVNSEHWTCFSHFSKYNCSRYLDSLHYSHVMHISYIVDNDYSIKRLFVFQWIKTTKTFCFIHETFLHKISGERE